MTDNTAEGPTDRVRTITLPWRSLLAGLAAVTYPIFVMNPDLVAFHQLPPHWFSTELMYPVAAIFIILVLVDLHYYHRQFRRQRADLQRLRDEVNELWEDKKRLQLKAHTYSDHADKLKRFISDKLLEYIEYDEKFLHFRSIAAEVRHNGVISFDKVQTALRDAMTVTGEESREKPVNRTELSAAMDAMRYLWDLLDLSTADNLALHIGNLLCECEEHYYQRMLADQNDSDTVPDEPVYLPGRAARRALEHVCHQALPESETDGSFRMDDGHWHVRIEPVNPLLGNENHLVLMLENLLKNAQFYSRKRGYNSPFAPVAMTLAEDGGNARLQVYNRGPHIRDEDRQTLFQLGFSTRRTREQHGRGLGLYFVNEIIKGYEGQTRVHNIETPQAQYALRIELGNDEVMTELIDITVDNGKPRCRIAGGEWTHSGEWTLASPLRSLEVTATGNQSTQRLDGFESKGRQSRFDPDHPESPHWRITYQPKRNAHRVSFEPLDISGVAFDVTLPTAQQRLTSSEMGLDEDIDAEVERLDEHFRNPEVDDRNS